MLRILAAAIIATSCASTLSPSTLGQTPVAAGVPEAHHEGAGHDWNATYRAGTGFNQKANALLVSVVEAQFHHPMGAFGTGELEGLFSGFKVLRSEVVEDVADFGEKKAKLVRFVAQKPQRG